MQKILAIDDKQDNLITLSALLKNLMPGCVVITAQSGKEGIAKAKAELPDAILLDVKMPEMDGFETCRRLMDDESTQHIPVIMITAIKTDPESRIEGLDQQGIGHKVHVGDGVFETGRHESGDRKDDGQDFVRHTAGRIRQPDCQADQGIAQDAQYQRLYEPQVYFPYGDL